MKSRRKSGRDSKIPGMYEDSRSSESSNKNWNHIVGIGGSAGGLESFERFFAGIPPNTGMVFVIVQHLDPNHKALMPELLQRSIIMPVHEIEDGMQIDANHVYVIPPNSELTISDGILHLSKPSEPHGLRLPIDSFFKSLAAEAGDKSVAVIVSGMGTDGTLGLKAIKEVGGVVMVESPDLAKFDGMPRSAISTGQVDYVAPIDELPQELIAYIEHAPRLHSKIMEGHIVPASSLSKLLYMLTMRTGDDFSLYKKSTLYRRVAKRAGMHGINDISEYVRYVEANPEELDALCKEFLIGVTRFFRDPAAFNYLESRVIPDIVKQAVKGGSIRVWVPACSTGEEAYSLAILLRECIESIRPNADLQIQIFATDIDSQAIETARKGFYPANIVSDVSPERLDRFFTKVEDGYAVKKTIRKSVVFAPQNITADPPFTKIDLVSCRNLLIYFSPELQRKVVPVFHYSLNPGGFLFLGNAEGIGSFEDLFAVIDNKWKVFRRKDMTATRARLMDIPFRPPLNETVNIANSEKEVPVGIQEALWQNLLVRYAPPSVVVTTNGDIVLVSGKTGNYLEPAEGKANWNINVMAREGLRLELPGAIHRVAEKKQDVILKGLLVKTNGDYKKVDVTVSPLLQRSSVDNLIIVTFQDVTSPENPEDQTESSGNADLRYKELEKELAYTKERLQTTLEEIESTQEELKSANEEMQSANEELQSTNEELTTSKEELQSLNEELVTLNTELQSKVDDLTLLNNDIVNLLNSTQLATIFLDNELHIKRFTPAVVGTFNLRSIDIGRPITDITQNLLYETIERDVTEVLRTLAIHEKTVESRDGNWFIMRIMPYRTLDNVIDGVVVTFFNVTEMKQLESAISKSESLSRALNDIHVEISSSLDVDRVMYAIAVKAAEALGVDYGGITMRENDEWVVRYVSANQKLQPGTRITDNDAPYINLIARTKEPLAITDTSKDNRISRDLAQGCDIRAVLGVPLIASGDLLGVLSLVSKSGPFSFTSDDIEFAHKLGLAVSLALDNSRLYQAERQAKSDAETARVKLVEHHNMLQQALLPADPFVKPGYSLATRFIPGVAGKSIGGDFYDIFETENGKIAILIGDVSGKGVEAAAMAVATRSTARAFAYDIADPAQALTHTNAVISRSPLSERFATAFLAMIDPDTGHYKYATAGHPPPMVRRKGGVVELLVAGQCPIGLEDIVEYKVSESRLDLGDQLVMYTDGISEARKGLDMLDLEGIIDILSKCTGCSAYQTLEALFRAALTFTQGQLADDAAVVIIERSAD